ncbi:MAG: SURF1 family protein [Chloroflexota bacterium]
MKKLLTPRWLIGHGLVLLAVIVLINLGLWQLRRLEQRRALNDSIRAGLAAPVTVLTGQDVDPAALHRRRVSVTGTFDNPAAIIIRNRPFQGQPGVHLVTPLKIKGSERAVLVDRGWIPLDDAEPDKRRVYDMPGEVTINGVAYPGQTQPTGYLIPTDPTLEPGQARLDAWFRLDIDHIQQQAPYPLLPIYIEQSPQPGAELSTPPRPENNTNPALDEGPHLGYALQWFSFALILVITYGVFVRQELKVRGHIVTTGQ